MPVFYIRTWILAGDDKRESYTVRRFLRAEEGCNVSVQPVVPREFDIIATREGRKSIHYEGKLVEIADCLIPRMGSSTTYFALPVIRHLERLGVFVLNSSLSIETSKDKLATMQVLAANSIPTPKTMLAKFPLSIDIVEKEFSYPIVIKTVSGSHGKGVFLCHTRMQLQHLRDKLLAGIRGVRTCHGNRCAERGISLPLCPSRPGAITVFQSRFQTLREGTR